MWHRVMLDVALAVSVHGSAGVRVDAGATTQDVPIRTGLAAAGSSSSSSSHATVLANDAWLAETSAALQPHFARLEASGMSFDRELDDFLAGLPAPDPSQGRRALQDIDDNHALLLRNHLPDTVGAPTATCEDQLATNAGAVGDCSYSCTALQQTFFPGEESRCFQYEGGAWPNELLDMRRQRLDDYVYANASLYERGRPVPFTVGEGGGCINVTITTFHEEDDEAAAHVETRCIEHGEHEHNHNAAHSIEVDGASSPVTSAGGTTAFVVGDCTDVLIRIVTETSAQVQTLTWRVERTGTTQSWEFEASASTAASPFEFYSCFFDADYTVALLDDSLGWLGKVSVVGYVNYQDTIIVPNDERWILQGALDSDGVPVQLDARISSGGPNTLTNASIVMRHIRFTERIAPLDLDVATRGFSTRPEAKLGGAFFYEGGFGAKLVFDHLVFDRCGDMSHSGGAVHISGRGEDTPRGQFPEAGLHWKIRNSLFFRNVAGIVAGFRTVNIWPLEFIMEDTHFVDNAAVVAHWCHQWYPDMNTEGGHRAAGSDIVLTRTKTIHSIYDDSPRSLELLNAMVFSFPGTNSVSGAPRNNLTIQDLEFSGHVALFHSAMIHQMMEDGDGVWDVSIDRGNYSQNLGYATVNIYTVGALTLMSHSNYGNNFYIARTRFDQNVVDPGTYEDQIAQGGGVIANIGGVAKFEESQWSGNIASSGGGMRVLGPGSVEFVRCYFAENTALSRGGAISSGIAEMIIRDSSFVRNTVVPPSDATLVTVFARVHFELDTRTYPVWKVDGIPPITTCPPSHRSGDDCDVEVTGRVSANEKLYRNPIATNCTGGGPDDVCLSRGEDYTEVLQLAPGRHTLWHGSQLNTTMPTMDWAGQGWIDIVDVMPKVYVTFTDNRATADEYGYARSQGCTQGNEDADYVHQNACEYGQYFWSSTDFDVPYGTGGAIHVSGGGSLTILRTTFADNSAGEGASLASVGDDVIVAIDTGFGELHEGDLSLVTLSGRFADCEEPQPCSTGQECSFARSSRSCSDCGSNEISADGRTCQRCPPGTQPDATQTQCEGCGPSEYSNDGLCRNCPAGTTPNDDHVTCTGCPLGTAGASGICAPCGPGEQPNEQRVACETCPLGKAGVGTCEFCDAGKMPDDAHVACISCPVGRAGLSGTCESCPAGTTPNDDHVTCTGCPLGTAGASGICAPCGPGEQPNEQRVACETCPLGKAGVGTCEFCDAGKMPDDAHVACISCPAGRAGLSGTCESCPAGKQPRNDSIACDICSPGKYSLGSACVSCGDGEMPTETGAACMACPDGTAGVGGFCELCDSREEANFDRTSCQCKGNKYNLDVFGPVWCDNSMDDVGDDTCAECPICLDCSEANVRLRVGWAFYGQGRAYTCPVSEGCNGHAHNRTLEHFDQSRATWSEHGDHIYPFTDTAINSQCAKGYAGPTCGECITDQAASADNYHHLRVGKPCVLCGEGTVNLPKLALLILVAVVAGILIASGIVNTISDHGMLTDAR
eukprot:COSAG02_NODE_1456_length_12512_cov_17.368082_3_plen_1508_part_00